MERRDFLKVLGLTGAGASLFGCSTESAEKLIPYVVQPEEFVPGTSTWYRTTCRECPAGCGMSVKTREGRAIKAEGNPFSPVGHGKLCARGQASLHGVYDPDRIPQALARDGEGWSKLTWDNAEQRLADALARSRGQAVFLTQSHTGAMDRLLDTWCDAMGVERVRFEAFALEPLRAANRLLYGVDAPPVQDFAAADVVVSFGADFMETWLSPVDYAHGFVEGHAYNGGRRGRFIAVTPHQSLTDLNADHWLAIRPGTEHLVALAMAKVVAERTGDASAARVLNRVDVAEVADAAGIDAGAIRETADAFANGGRSLAVGPGVASSHRAATQVALAVAILNQVAGNVGRTVRFSRHETGVAAGTYAELRSLIERIRSGEVSTLLVHGANPLHSVPGEGDLRAAFDGIDFVASFSSHLDETASRADLLLPDHQFLEGWGDHEPRTGIHSLVQPTMTPVFHTKQTGDVLLSVARRAGAVLPTQATTFYDYLREDWRARVYPAVDSGGKPFDAWWIEALKAGVVVEDATPERRRTLRQAGLAAVSMDAPAFDGGDDAEYYLVVYPSYRFYDGRGANRPWLQELPDPVSKLTWSSWVEVNPRTADELGLDNGHIVEVETPHGRAELPVWRHPGMREDVIAVQLGQGHEAYGRYARDRGMNAARLLAPTVEAASGGVVWFQTRALITPTGRWQRPPTSSHQYTTQGREEIVETVSLEEATRAQPTSVLMAMATGAAAQEAGEHGGEHEQALEGQVRTLQESGGFMPVEVGRGPQEYPPPGTHYGEYSDEQPRWAMSIDMDRCIGCSACMTACQAENNIAVVGPELVTDGRILHWIRIERYFEFEGADNGHDHADGSGELKGTNFLPMLCQQCGNAPCEPVCPVYASYHTPDGLNAQVYNRCVGTRYCANNCPYKVRYFNFFTYEWPEPLNWQLNPDVTVREKGIMEKCTFCVQRIRHGEHQARLDGRPLRDGEVVPACAQTCPGNAIVFGNIKDPNSRVAKVAASGRGYRVLDGELNTQPAVTYLKRVVDEPVEV